MKLQKYFKMRVKYLLECLDLIEMILDYDSKIKIITNGLKNFDVNEHALYYELTSRYDDESVDDVTITKFCLTNFSRDIEMEKKNYFFFLNQFENVILYLNKKINDEENITSNNSIFLNILKDNLVYDIHSTLIRMTKKINVIGDVTTLEKLKINRGYFKNEAFFDSFFVNLTKKRAHLENPDLISLVMESAAPGNKAWNKYYGIPSKNKINQFSNKVTMNTLCDPINISFSVKESNSSLFNYQVFESNDILFCYAVIKFITTHNNTFLFETIIFESILHSYKYLISKDDNDNFSLENFIKLTWVETPSFSNEEYFDEDEDKHLLGKSGIDLFFLSESIQKLTSHIYYLPSVMAIKISKKSKIDDDKILVTQTREENDNLFFNISSILENPHIDSYNNYKKKFNIKHLNADIDSGESNIKQAISAVIYCIISMISEYIFKWIIENCVVRNESNLSPVLDEFEEKILVKSMIDDYYIIFNEYRNMIDTKTCDNIKIAIDKIQNYRMNVDYISLLSKFNDVEDDFDVENETTPFINFGEEAIQNVIELFKIIIINVNNTSIQNNSIIIREYEVKNDKDYNMMRFNFFSQKNLSELYKNLLFYFKDISQIIYNNETLSFDYYQHINSTKKMVKKKNTLNQYVKVENKIRFKPCQIDDLDSNKNLSIILESLINNNDTNALDSLIKIKDDHEHSSSIYECLYFGIDRVNSMEYMNDISKDQLENTMRMLSKKYFLGTLIRNVDYIVLEEEMLSSYVNKECDYLKPKDIKISQIIGVQIKDVGVSKYAPYSLSSRSRCNPKLGAKLIIKKEILEVIQRSYICNKQKPNTLLFPAQLSFAQNIYSMNVYVRALAIKSFYSQYFKKIASSSDTPKIEEYSNWIESISYQIQLLLNNNNKSECYNINNIFNTEHSKLQYLFNIGTHKKSTLTLQKYKFTMGSNMKQIISMIVQDINTHDYSTIKKQMILYCVRKLFEEMNDIEIKSEDEITLSLCDIINTNLNERENVSIINNIKKTRTISTTEQYHNNSHITSINKFISKNNLFYSLYNTMQQAHEFENNFIIPKIIILNILKEYIQKDKLLAAIINNAVSAIVTKRKNINIEDKIDLSKIQESEIDKHYNCSSDILMNIPQVIIDHYFQNEIYEPIKQIQIFLGNNENSILGNILKDSDVLQIFTLYPKNIMNEIIIPNKIAINVKSLILKLICTHTTNNPTHDQYIYSLTNKQSKVILKYNANNNNISNKKIDYYFAEYCQNNKLGNKKLLYENGKEFTELNHIMKECLDNNNIAKIVTTEIPSKQKLINNMLVKPNILINIIRDFDDFIKRMVDQKKIHAFTTYVSNDIKNNMCKNIILENTIIYAKNKLTRYSNLEKMILSNLSKQETGKNVEQYHDIPFSISTSSKEKMIISEDKNEILYRSQIFPILKKKYSSKENYVLKNLHQQFTKRYKKNYYLYKSQDIYYTTHTIRYDINNKNSNISIHPKQTQKNWFITFKYKSPGVTKNIFDTVNSCPIKNITFPRPLYLNSIIMDMLINNK